SATLTATITSSAGAPTSGTVAFTDNGTGITGCGAVAITVGASSSTATCTPTFATQGMHNIIATYSGGGTFATSSNTPAFNQFVKNHSTLTAGQYCNAGAVSNSGSNDTQSYPTIVNIGTDTTAINNSVATLSLQLKGLSGPGGLGAVKALLVGPGG